MAQLSFPFDKGRSVYKVGNQNAVMVVVESYSIMEKKYSQVLPRAQAISTIYYVVLNGARSLPEKYTYFAEGRREKC